MGMDNLFEEFEEVIPNMPQNLRSSFFAFIEEVKDTPNVKDGALIYMILSLMKENLEMKKELEIARKSHISLMNIYADNN